MAIKKLQVTPEYVAQLEAQVKELKKENRILMKGTEVLGTECEKYKQFVERVKEQVYDGSGRYDERFLLEDKLKQIIEELK